MESSPTRHRHGTDLKGEGLSILLAESNERHVADLLDSIYSIERGSIGPGRLADLVVLSGDPTACSPAELLALRPEMTVVGGRVAWPTVKG